MALPDLVTLPFRLGVAATRTTLVLGTLTHPDGPVRRPGGYADMVRGLIGAGGTSERVNELLADDAAVMRIVRTLDSVFAADRPLGRMLRRGGTLDRLLDEDGPVLRLAEPGGVLDRLSAENGPLDRLMAPGGAVDRLTQPDGTIDRLLAPGGAVERLIDGDGLVDRLLAPGGVLDRLTRDDGVLERVLAPGGLVERMLAEEGFVETLVADGGTLDRLVALGPALEAVEPRLRELAAVIPSLAATADSLQHAVGPLGDLANRLPGGPRRRALGSAASGAGEG
ncbi:hypothetical protein [uncultured Nocardioides sp.]|uniref:hypothetical protein n=1 Tax=uncultured Nocardioides sp. TaxID=198441 RepID=UPI00262AFE3A|nr:hypothetical protein [uncultured Nocardioides sp.]